MKSCSLLLVLAFSASVPVHPMNFSWLKPAASCAASAAYSCGSALAKRAGYVGGSLKEHKVLAGLGAGAVAGLVILAYNAKQYSRTALHWAVMNGHAEIARILVQAGANIEAVDNDGYTVLHWAVIEGHAEIVRILVQAGANKEAVYRDGYTALHFAVIAGHAEIVRILLHAGANIEAVTGDSRTALHLATIKGHAEIVRILLHAGANIEAVTGDRRTALHWATIKGHAKIARILVLEGGANTRAVDCYGLVALYWATTEGRAEIDRRMNVAVQNGDIATVQELVDLGVPIYSACIADAIRAYNPQEPTVHDHIARLLLKTIGVRQADRTRNSKGQTLLHVAAARGNLWIAEYLLRNGADANAVDQHGNTPLHVTTEPKMRDKLLRHGADVSKLNRAGEVPISSSINAWMPCIQEGALPAVVS